MAQVWFTWRYHYNFLYHLSWPLIVIIGMWIAANIFFSQWLVDHPNPYVRAFGKAYQTVFGLTACMQGVFYVTLIYYVLGVSVYPEQATLYWFDWIYAMTDASWIIYGIGFAPMIMVADGFWKKTGMILTVGTAWALCGYFFLYEEEARHVFNTHPDLSIAACMGIQLLLSVICMYEVIFSKGATPDDASKTVA